MDFVYVAGGPQGAHEQKVADAGYKWVRTNALEPTQAHKPIDFAKPDRLLAHSHHGENTHLIVEGDLRIEESLPHHDAPRGRSPHRQGQQRQRRTFEISTARGADREKAVGPGVTYSGSSRSGCRFVEGHRRLSPASAERFIARGTLRAAAATTTTTTTAAVVQVTTTEGSGSGSGSTTASTTASTAGSGSSSSSWNLPDEKTLRRWLREAKFRPGRQALLPGWDGDWSWWSGEEKKSVVTFAEMPASREERRAQFAIASWFEREWAGVVDVFDDHANANANANANVGADAGDGWKIRIVVYLFLLGFVLAIVLRWFF